LPTQFAQAQPISRISRFITRQFRSPVTLSAIWNPTVFAFLVLMPKTTVQKDELLSFAKDNVGPARQLVSMYSISKPKLINQFAQLSLGRRVFAADT
jgi:hypothetical protein